MVEQKGLYLHTHTHTHIYILYLVLCTICISFEVQIFTLLFTTLRDLTLKLPILILFSALNVVVPVGFVTPWIQRAMFQFPLCKQLHKNSSSLIKIVFFCDSLASNKWNKCDVFTPSLKRKIRRFENDSYENQAQITLE